MATATCRTRLPTTGRHTISRWRSTAGRPLPVTPGISRMTLIDARQWDQAAEWNQRAAGSRPRARCTRHVSVRGAESRPDRPGPRRFPGSRPNRPEPVARHRYPAQYSLGGVGLAGRSGCRRGAFSRSQPVLRAGPADHRGHARRPARPESPHDAALATDALLPRLPGRVVAAERRRARFARGGIQPRAGAGRAAGTGRRGDAAAEHGRIRTRGARRARATSSPSGWRPNAPLPG